MSMTGGLCDQIGFSEDVVYRVPDINYEPAWSFLRRLHAECVVCLAGLRFIQCLYRRLTRIFRLPEKFSKKPLAATMWRRMRRVRSRCMVLRICSGRVGYPKYL
jgi:hypothetical protein